MREQETTSVSSSGRLSSDKNLPRGVSRSKSIPRATIRRWCRRICGQRRGWEPDLQGNCLDRSLQGGQLRVLSGRATEANNRGLLEQSRRARSCEKESSDAEGRHVVVVVPP